MSHRSALLMLILTAPGAAFAAPKVLEDITPDTAYARGGVTNLSAEGNSFLKVDVAIGTDITVIPGVLTGKMELLIGPGHATFNQSMGGGLSASTEWSSDVFVALLGSGRLTVFRRSWLDVGTRFAYEATLFGADMRPDRFSFKDGSGSYDITDFARKHTALSASWTRLNLDLDFRVPLFPIWTAYASAGITRYTFALDLNIDSEGRDLIESIGQDPGAVDRTYELAYIIPTIRIGSDVDVGDLPIYLNAEVTLVPVSIEQLFLGAQLAIGLKL